MLKYIIISQLFFLQIAYSQTNRINFGYQRNIDLWKPFTDLPQNIEGFDQSFFSKTYQLDLSTPLYRKGKFAMLLGISFKKIDYRFENRIQNWDFKVQYASGGQSNYYFVNYHFEDPADLIAISKSIGIGTDNNLKLYQLKKLSGDLGINFRVYLLEFYNSFYESKDPIISEPGSPYYDYRPFPNYGPQNKFFLSSINISTYYRQGFLLKENFSLAARISLGTNLYSDWDQFKKYAWLGVGLEMGFGKVKKIID